MPTKNMTPAEPRLFCRFWMVLVRMSLAGPGATCETLSSSGCVADGPISPRIETNAMMAGKIARMP